ncbi:MAG: glycoside hydrolase family 32 protein [Bacteroidales bacterium]|nr:glycoside hydrolase family 32 protein [Bacteroidales bacterium]
MPYQEQHRPQIHFSPPGNWMNDPNGLVYYRGEYHLFYQYYPDGTVWGPMHWGHAFSRDLVYWENLPVALFPDALGSIFSGSAVIDRKNTSGLQTGEHPPMIAIFTHHDKTKQQKGKTDYQVQSLACSNDMGRNFVKYKHNPVIPNPGEPDFRDPKVTWNKSLQLWIMVLAAGQKVKFYGSPNLLYWDYLSDFGTGAGDHGGVWECPDLFPVKAGNEIKWILIVSINAGAPNGGSGTRYFIGYFDGVKFTNDNSEETELWLDYGPDNYAEVSWSDIPEEDGRRIVIGWMSNWDYAETVPTTAWRGALTLPRSISLRATERGLRLCSNPVSELKKIRNGKQSFEFNTDTIINISGLNEILMSTSLAENSAEEFGIIFSNSRKKKLVVGYNSRLNQFYVDRTNSGQTSFSPTFSNKAVAPRLTTDNILRMHIFLDVPSIELFADNGLVTLTAIFFPGEKFDSLSFFQTKGTVKNTQCVLFELNSIWK